MSEPEEYDGAGVMGVFVGLLIIYWILKAIISQADNTK